MAGILIKPLQKQMLLVKKQHNKGLEADFGSVYLAEAPARKYLNAEKEYRWQYLFDVRQSFQPPNAVLQTASRDAGNSP
jgi:hypothetical protein